MEAYLTAFDQCFLTEPISLVCYQNPELINQPADEEFKNSYRSARSINPSNYLDYERLISRRLK